MTPDPILAQLLAAIRLTAAAHQEALEDLAQYITPDASGRALVPLKLAADIWGISDDGARKRCRGTKEEPGVGIKVDGKWFAPRSALRSSSRG